MAEHLMEENRSSSADVTSAREKLQVIASQHKALLKICLTYLTRLNNVLDGDPAVGAMGLVSVQPYMSFFA